MFSAETKSLDGDQACISQIGEAHSLLVNILVFLVWRSTLVNAGSAVSPDQ